jgi:peptide chain release factor 1
LLDARLAKLEAERSQMRSAQVGTGDRSAKIRTYNYPQDRITDHRIGLDVHDLPGVLDGDLDRLIDALITTDQAERLASMERQLARA